MKLDSADKSDTVSFAKNAVSKELGENRAGAGVRLRRCFATFPPNRWRDSASHLKQLVKKVGAERLERSGNSRSEATAYATAMLEKAEEGAGVGASRFARRRFATCPSNRWRDSAAHLKENYALLKKLSEM